MKRGFAYEVLSVIITLVIKDVLYIVVLTIVLRASSCKGYISFAYN